MVLGIILLRCNKAYDEYENLVGSRATLYSLINDCERTLPRNKVCVLSVTAVEK